MFELKTTKCENDEYREVGQLRENVLPAHFASVSTEP